MDPARNKQGIDDLFRVVALLHPDSATATVYAKVAVELERKGQPIPENVIWIAAAAIECDMPLATRDAHFQRVPGLAVLSW